MALHVQHDSEPSLRETATPCYVALSDLIYKCNKYQERYTESTTPLFLWGKQNKTNTKIFRSKIMSSIWDVDERIVEQQAISFKVFENMTIDNEQGTDEFLAGMVGLEMIRERVRTNSDLTEQQVDKILGL